MSYLLSFTYSGFEIYIMIKYNINIQPMVITVIAFIGNLYNLGYLMSLGTPIFYYQKLLYLITEHT